MVQYNTVEIVYLKILKGLYDLGCRLEESIEIGCVWCPLNLADSCECHIELLCSVTIENFLTSKIFITDTSGGVFIIQTDVFVY
jgi:hypothetical protein